MVLLISKPLHNFSGPIAQFLYYQTQKGGENVSETQVLCEKSWTGMYMNSIKFTAVQIKKETCTCKKCGLQDGFKAISSSGGVLQT
jgi:hypothetical protein